MAQMVVRNIPDELMEWIKNTAKEEKKSAEQVVRDLIAESAKPSKAEILADVKKRLNHLPKPDANDFDFVAAIREDRER